VHFIRLTTMAGAAELRRAVAGVRIARVIPAAHEEPRLVVGGPDREVGHAVLVVTGRAGQRLGTGTLYIEPGSPWENGYCESFNGKLRDECLNGEIFYSLKEAQVVIEQWRVEYNTRRPHSALGYRPPVPAAYSPLETLSSVSQPRAVM
jgi:putative transposase